MLLILTATVVIQDHALEYEYMQPPTLISGFKFLIL